MKNARNVQKFIHLLVWTASTFGLAVVFYMVLTPLAAVLRMVRKPPLDVRANVHMASYWIKYQGELGNKEAAGFFRSSRRFWFIPLLIILVLLGLLIILGPGPAATPLIYTLF